jgi:hypothetical protein
MAFKPDYIEGRHYLMSKNSGSFPNWAIYLSGSSGQGKLWSEFNINASVSCSVSSSTTFTVGTVYQVDVRIVPALSASAIYVNGQSEGGAFGNGGGSLTNTGSLFVGNYFQDNTQNFSGSIYTVKSYTVQSLAQPPINYNVTATRLGKTPAPYVAPVFELLVVAGGGGGGSFRGGGGGAGGLQYFSNFTPDLGSSQVIVGGGGAVGSNGQNSAFITYTSIGGGRGGSGYQGGISGGSGGGGAASDVLQPGGLGIPGQGNAGGRGDNNSLRGGGGGGSGTPGLEGTTSGPIPPTGGSGSYIASFAVIGGLPAGWFAGGGGGGSINTLAGNGGIGGGGNGSGVTIPSTTASLNTGGGGGGSGAAGIGTSGSSGIVAIRYSGVPIALGGEITQSEGYTYHVFRTVGTSSFTIF